MFIFYHYIFSVCGINLHRLCVKLYEDICPGPITKKGIHKLMDFKTSKEPRRKLNSTQCEYDIHTSSNARNGLTLRIGKVEFTLCSQQESDTLHKYRVKEYIDEGRQFLHA